MRQPTPEFKRAVVALRTVTQFDYGQCVGIVAQWMHESISGNSKLAIEHRNYGGLKMRDELRPFGEGRPIKVPSEREPVSFAWFETPEKFAQGYEAFIERSPYVGWEKHENIGLIRHLWEAGYAVDPDYVEKVGQYIDDAEKLLEELQDERSELEPTWFEFHRFGVEPPVIVAYSGSKPLFELQTKKKGELIKFLETFEEANSFAVANGAKPIPDVPEFAVVVKKPEPANQRLKGLRVFLEAGHGWSGGSFDRGAVGHVEEWTQNKEQCTACAQALLDLGASVQVELYNGGTPARSLRQRGQMSDPCDVFVSFHNNAFNGQVQGTETLFDRLGDSDDEWLANAVHSHLYPATGFRNRGVKRQGLGVLRGAKKASFAACLTESYFVDGPGLPSDTSGLNKRIGEAVALGIRDFALGSAEMKRRMQND